MADYEDQVSPIMTPPRRACEKLRQWRDLVGAEAVKEARNVNFSMKYQYLGQYAELQPDPKALAIVREIFHRDATLNMKILCRLPVDEGLHDKQGRPLEGVEVYWKPTDTSEMWKMQMIRSGQHFLREFLDLTHNPYEERLRAIVISAAEFFIAGIVPLHAFVTGTDRPVFGPDPPPAMEAEWENLALQKRKEIWEEKRESVHRAVMAENGD